MRKPACCICEIKEADQLCGNPEADQRLRFSLHGKVLSLCFLNPKFQASMHLLLLYRPVSFGPGRKPEDRFSLNEAHMICIMDKPVFLIWEFAFCICENK